MDKKVLKIDKDNVTNNFLEGVKMVKNMMKFLYGPNSKNFFYKSISKNQVEVLSDGRKVAELFKNHEIHELNDFAKLSASFFAEYIVQMNVEGDGGTTFSIFAEKLLNTTYKKNIKERYITKDVLNCFRDCLLKLIEKISYKKIDSNILESVGILASNGDEEIGKCLRKAYEIGKEHTIIIPKKYNNINIELKQQEGYAINIGVGIDLFFREEEIGSKRIVMNNPVIILSSTKINSLSDTFNQFINTLLKSNKSILLITPVDSNLSQTASELRTKANVEIVHIGLPTLSSIGLKDQIDDLTKYLGCKDFSETQNTSQLNEDLLGSAESVEITSQKTLIIGGKGKKEVIEERKSKLELALKNTPAEETFIRKGLEERLANLNSSLFYLFIGAANTIDYEEKLQGINDAKASCLACFSGVVPGSGCEYIILNYLLQKTPNNDVLFQGYNEHIVKIVKEIAEEVLLEPFRILAENSEESFDLLLIKIKDRIEKGEYDFSYNFNTKLLDKMVKTGIMTPEKTVKKIISLSTQFTKLGLSSAVMGYETIQENK